MHNNNRCKDNSNFSVNYNTLSCKSNYLLLLKINFSNKNHYNYYCY